MIVTNQIRLKIGVMFGNPETQPGGRALKFYASVRVDLRRIGSIKDGDQVTGNRVRATVVKNKIAPPFRKTEFDIMFSEGISRPGDLVDLGVSSGVIQKSGTWLSFGETRIGQGREKAKTFLRENPDVMGEIERDVRKALGAPGEAVETDEEGNGAAGGAEAETKREAAASA